jgi:putative glycosyltransferase (TIGR04372 family)
MERFLLAIFGPRLLSIAGAGYWILVGLFRALRAGLFAMVLDWRKWPSAPPPHWAEHWQHAYEADVAPRRAVRWGWAYRPIGLILKWLGIRFVVNIFPGMGHNTVELDYFFRRQKLGEWPAHLKFVLARRCNQVHLDTMDLYAQRFWVAPRTTSLFNITLPLTMRCQDIIVDCGLSRLKWQLDAGTFWKIPPKGQTFLHQISKDEVGQSWKSYYEIRAQTQQFFPLREGLTLDPELLEFLGGRAEKLALIHIKLHVMNATGAPTDPASYLPAISHLQSEGYRVVFVGREEMPPSFKLLGVLNYAQSGVASYKHDLQLFAAASLAITAGSGVALIPDCMGIPLVYLDSWHIGMPLFSPLCVSVPSLVEDVQTGRLLSFDEQIQLYETLPDHGDEVFPEAKWRARNAGADDVLAAVREVLDLRQNSRPRSALQERFCQLRQDGLLGVTQSRVSDAFLEKYRDLLPA